MWPATLGIGWFCVAIGLLLYSTYLTVEDRATLIASSTSVPQKKDLLTYILAFAHDGKEIHDQAALIVSTLLEQLSEDELLAIDDEYWRRLCRLPRNNPMPNFSDEEEGRDDHVHVSMFSAIMRIKRMKSLPYIETMIRSLDTNRHSEDYVRTLHASHETLLNQKASLLHSGTLLRPSSAETATPEVLLRPVQGSNFSETETGEQLLRASPGENSSHSIPQDTGSSTEKSPPVGQDMPEVLPLEHRWEQRL